MRELNEMLNNIISLEQVENEKNRICFIVDYGKSKGSYISIVRFNHFGLTDYEYNVSYGSIEDNKRIVFEFRNNICKSKKETMEIIAKAINHLYLQ